MSVRTAGTKKSKKHIVILAFPPIVSRIDNGDISITNSRRGARDVPSDVSVKVMGLE